MTKILIKKQLSEILAFYFGGGKTKNGKNSKLQGKSMAILAAFVFLAMSAVFFFLSLQMARPMYEGGVGWLYFVMLGLIGMVLGVICSIFNTYASLYNAKDNELLLSLPVKPGAILFARMTGEYVVSLIFEGMVTVPAYIAWAVCGGFSPNGLVCYIIIVLAQAFVVLILDCILGWFVALIASKIKHKTPIVLLGSLGFMAVYFLFYNKFRDYLNGIIENIGAISKNIEENHRVIYMYGQAAAGNVLYTAAVGIVIAILFGITYFILSKSFGKILTSNRSAGKIKYKEKRLKSASARAALFRRELMHFLSSPNYMLNCSMGTILTVVATIALIVKSGSIDTALDNMTGNIPQTGLILPLIFGAAAMLFGATNNITAPSVSLEGKNIWLVRSLPVRTLDILLAKLKLHIVITVPPIFILTVVAEIFLKISPAELVIVWILMLVYTLFCAQLGLVFNLKAPKLDWTNEIVPVKQSFATFLSMLFGMLILIGLVIVTILIMPLIIGGILPSAAYMLIITILFGCFDWLLFIWIKGKGCRIFEEL